MRNIINFNDDWKFYKNTGSLDNAESISLPHSWNALDGQDGGNDYFRGPCFYYKEFPKNEFPIAECYYLEITGANSSAAVTINGKKVATHHGGYSTFRVDLTDYLQDKNTLEIMVDNSANETVYPQMADFTFYGGLYRNVNIIAVNKTHFDLDYFGSKGILITPHIAGLNANIHIETFVTNLGANDKLLYLIYDNEENLILEKESSETTADFTIYSVHLWNGILDPYLYTAKVSVIRENEELDTIISRFGCRSFEINPQKGFILNEKEYPLRGVSRHQDRAGIGNALLEKHHKEDMDLICEVGANTIRLAHYQHDQYFYDLCDEKGMIVWAEIPYISKHMPDANENTVLQMKELIVQNYNHPCIVVWGLSNEITMDGAKDSDMIENHKRLNDLVHQMDKTRHTTLACLTMCGINEEIVHITDVVAYNHYFGWYGGSTADNGIWFDKFHEKYPNRSIGCSEYGCEALNWHTSSPKQGDYTEEYQAYYHEELIKQLFTRPYLWATYVWNMFDFGADARAEGGENGQNHKGLVTFDRQYKKDSFYAYKAWLSKDPFVHLCGKRYIDRVEDVTKVTVYSNLPEVELFANGVSLGKKSAPDHFFYFDVPNNGETHLLAVSGSFRDESIIKKVNEMNPDYILREQGAVLNWFDISQPEGYFSLNDTLGDISKTARGKIWFTRFLLTLSEKQKNSSASNKKTMKADMNSDFLKMLSSFTVLRLTSMLGMQNISFTKEELLKMNTKLNKIRKPNK